VDAATVRTILLEGADPKSREDIMNAGEQLIEQGREQGLEQGRAQGREQGLEQGRAGLRASLVAAFSARAVSLSDSGRARVAVCTDIAVLTTWLTRALTASSEAEVFG
jgi:hypothetical protein